MPSNRYILVCTTDPQHHWFVEQDAWVWSGGQNMRLVMPQDALDEPPTGTRLKRIRCSECGATVTFREQEQKS